MAVKKTLREVHRRINRLNRKKNKRKKAKSNGQHNYETLEPRRVLNAAPVGNADRHYYTDIGVDLQISANEGLVVNDFDLEESRLGVEGGVTRKAKQFTPTDQGGSLLAFETGAFYYIPPTNFEGIDSFLYQADDGESLSPPVEVTIAVGTPLTAQLNVAEYNVDNFLHTGVLQTTQPLGGGLELNYRSDSVPTPIIAVETKLLPDTPVPDRIEVYTTIGGHDSELTTYTTENFNPDEPLRFVQRVLAPDLETGIHDWTMYVSLNYNDGPALQQEFHGQHTVVNRVNSEFGTGWWLNGYDQIVPSGDGALLVNSDGSTFHFPLGDNGYELANGDASFSTLVDNGNGFTLTDKWGDTREFDQSGRMTAVGRVKRTIKASSCG